MLEFKLAVTALLAACTALWGWFGWLVLLWIACLLLDYITGSLAAASLGNWSSKQARQGIWHKLGCIVAVMVAAAADLLLGMVTEHVPGVPLEYNTILCPMVIVWYTLTELGSLMEHAVQLGAPVPDFLKRALQVFQEKK